jgi:hypothetical protein
MGRLNADFGCCSLDIVYDSATDSFENLTTTTAALAIEHNWTPSLSTSVAAGYIDIDLEDFQDDLSFNHGFRTLVNLIWRPKGKLDGLLVGIEYEFAERDNKDDTSTQANRVNLATYYDF